MGFFEAQELISLVKLGVDMEIVPIEDFNILQVGVGIGTAHLKKLLDGEAEKEDVDRERAVQLRRMLDL
jgi:protein-arginine kinase